MKLSCKDCEYFVQHYAYDQYGFSWLDIGHCIAGKRIKQVKPNQIGCLLWREPEKPHPSPPDVKEP